MEAVLAAIRKLKIDGLGLNTRSIRVEQLFEPVKQGGSGGPGAPPASSYYDEQYMRKTAGYRVQNSVSAKVTG